MAAGAVFGTGAPPEMRSRIMSATSADLRRRSIAKEGTPDKELIFSDLMSCTTVIG
jgi:hypothetical protein